MPNELLILGAGALGLAVIATLVTMLFGVERFTVAIAKHRRRYWRPIGTGKRAKQSFKENP